MLLFYLFLAKGSKECENGDRLSAANDFPKNLTRY